MSPNHPFEGMVTHRVDISSIGSRILSVDDLIDGRYRVVGYRAAGAYAEVYEAHDLDHARRVALKVLKRDAAEHAGRVRRAAQLAMERLDHPGIVPVFAAGVFETTSGRRATYVVSEFIDGPTFESTLDTAPMPFGEAIEHVDRVLAAIAHAHAQGIVHRDISPRNLLVGPDGFPRLTDFDLLKYSDASVKLTGSAQPMGTPHYRAPELDDAARATPAADLFSIGVLLHELLTMRRPTRDDNARSVTINDPFGFVPSDVEPILSRMLAWAPGDRVGRAWNYRVDLARAAGVEPPRGPERLETVELDDRFRVELFVGAGGMADVYRARDLRLQRQVAMKVSREAFFKEALEAFHREARIAANMEHDTVVPVYDMGSAVVDGVDEHYLVLRYMAAGSLATQIINSGIESADHVLAIACDVADALAFLHERGIVHRDIKPGNVLLAEDEHARLSDFSIAFDVAKGPPERGKSPATPGYEPPELLDNPPRIGHFTDSYQFGMLLFELLCGSLPREGHTGHIHQALEQRGIGFRPSQEPSAMPGAAAFDDLVAALTQPRWDQRPVGLEVVRLVRTISVTTPATVDVTIVRLGLSPATVAVVPGTTVADVFATAGFDHNGYSRWSLSSVDGSPLELSSCINNDLTIICGMAISGSAPGYESQLAHSAPVRRFPTVRDEHALRRSWLVQGRTPDNGALDISDLWDASAEMPNENDRVFVVDRASMAWIGSFTTDGRARASIAFVAPLPRPVRVTSIPLEVRVDAAQGRRPPFHPSGRFSGEPISLLPAALLQLLPHQDQ